MIWHQWNTRACCLASLEPGSGHGPSQEHLMAKKGNNFLYVSSGQMVADAEVWESWPLWAEGPDVIINSGSRGWKEKPWPLMESGKSPAWGVRDWGLVTGLSPAVSPRSSLIFFPFFRQRKCRLKYLRQSLLVVWLCTCYLTSEPQFFHLWNGIILLS